MSGRGAGSPPERRLRTAGGRRVARPASVDLYFIRFELHLRNISHFHRVFSRYEVWINLQGISFFRLRFQINDEIRFVSMLNESFKYVLYLI